MLGFQGVQPLCPCLICCDDAHAGTPPSLVQPCDRAAMAVKSNAHYALGIGAGAGQIARTSYSISDIIVVTGRMADGIASGSPGSPLKRTDLRNHAVVIEKRDLTRINRRQELTIKLRGREFGVQPKCRPDAKPPPRSSTHTDPASLHECHSV